jgi:hypothetical protein
MKNTTASIPTWTLLPRPAMPAESNGGSLVPSSSRSVSVQGKDREVSLSPNFDPDVDFVLTSPSTVCLSSHDFNRISEQGMPPQLPPTRGAATAGTGESRRSLGVRLRPRPKYREFGFVSPYSPICLQRRDVPRRGVASSLCDHPPRAVLPSDAPLTFTPCPPTSSRCSSCEPPPPASEAIAPETPSVVLGPLANLSFASPETERPVAPPLLPDFLTNTT